MPQIYPNLGRTELASHIVEAIPWILGAAKISGITVMQHQNVWGATFKKWFLEVISSVLSRNSGNSRIWLLHFLKCVQNFVLLSRLQGRGRAAKFLILCLILCLLIWTISRKSRVSLLISTKRLPHQEPTREIVFQLFRHYRYPRNMTLTTLIRYSWQRVCYAEDVWRRWAWGTRCRG
jgi:hypothetical protein